MSGNDFLFHPVVCSCFCHCNVLRAGQNPEWVISKNSSNRTPEQEIPLCWSL